MSETTLTKDEITELRRKCPTHGQLGLNGEMLTKLLDAAERAETLTAELAECYRLTGADPDGNEDWRLAEWAVDAVRELREDSDREIAKAESALAPLRAVVEAAKDWPMIRILIADAWMGAENLRTNAEALARLQKALDALPADPSAPTP